MNVIRSRAKEHFPTVLLTLLSIVQALALEMLWSHLRETVALYEFSWLMVMSWVQISATFLSLMIIWIVYASMVMRFRWVPSTGDSVFPFFIGILEFMLIESLGPTTLGLWFFIMALIFGLMYWSNHATMRRARRDDDNKVFFRNVKPAVLSDFYREIVIVSVLTLAGVYILLTGDQGITGMVALLATNGFLAYQFYSAATFWESSIAESSITESSIAESTDKESHE